MGNIWPLTHFLQGLCMLLSSVERPKGEETVTMWFSSIRTLFTAQIPALAPEFNERCQKKQYWRPYPSHLTKHKVITSLCFPADLLPSQHQTDLKARLSGHILTAACAQQIMGLSTVTWMSAVSRLWGTWKCWPDRKRVTMA